MTRSTLPNAGHLPGHIHDAFLLAIEQADGPEKRRLAGVVWSCTDTLPSSSCDALEIPSGSSYAQAARHIRAAVRV